MHNSSMTKIADLKPGESAKILHFIKGKSGYRQRLLALGLTPGSHLTVIRKAPLGDPIQIQIRTSQLTLRKAEVDLIEVERVSS